MFQLDGLLTNTRAPKDDRPLIVTSKTEGNCRLMENAAKIIGVGDDDYLGIGTFEGTVYVFRGVKGDKENNQPQIGAKLGYASGSAGGALLFSSTRPWRELGEGEKKWLVDEANAQEGEGGLMYYPLVDVTGQDAPAPEEASDNEE